MEDLEELKARSRAVWGTGDYGPTSRQLEPAAEALVAALGIAGGDRVLDVAAGHGNCAIAAARRGAEVTAADFSEHMIAAGRARTEALGLPVGWREADAAGLPFAEGDFDVVTSVFGMIFAAEQEQAAAEAVRVLRPGGRLGLTAWTPDGLTARMLALGRRCWPAPPPGAPDPYRWGRPEELARLFGPLGGAVETTRRTLTFRYASWEEWAHAGEAHGMAVVARRTMAAEDYHRLRADQRALAEEHDRGEGGEVVIDSDYLEVVVRTG